MVTSESGCPVVIETLAGATLLPMWLVLGTVGNAAI